MMEYLVADIERMKKKRRQRKDMNEEMRAGHKELMVVMTASHGEFMSVMKTNQKNNG
jgi:hypothetical protein